jgi:hypothetical protein
MFIETVWPRFKVLKQQLNLNPKATARTALDRYLFIYFRVSNSGPSSSLRNAGSVRAH